MEEIEVNYGLTLPIESFKVIAESVGIGNLSDDAAKEISDSATYRLKLVLQVLYYVIMLLCCKVFLIIKKLEVRLVLLFLFDNFF